MDYLLLAICGVYAIKGFVKGFVRMLLSFISFALIIFIAYEIATNTINLFGLNDYLQNIFKNMLDGMGLGTFSNKNEIYIALEGANVNVMLIALLKILLNNIEFEGNLTFGQIFSPTLADFTYRIIIFFGSFVIVLLLTRLVAFLLGFILKKTGLTPVNRFFGFVLGVFKGVIISTLIFVSLSLLASLNLSEGLTNFVNSGYVSKFIYENHIIKLFDGLYSIFS